MDNQLFPGGGAFLDDVAQVCTLCGMMFNNALTYQHHMQLHILSANAQMLGTQPPPDPGIGMPTAASILDLMGGVSQHALSTGAGVPLVPPQAVFSGAAASTMPPHLISPGVGLVTGSLPNLGLPQQSSGRVKEKKQKASTKTPTSSSSNTSATSVQRPNGPGTFKSHENSTSTYISTFPKDLQKMDHLSPKAHGAQHSQTKAAGDIFSVSTPQIDSLEALILTSPVKPAAPGFERQLSRKSTGSPKDAVVVNKDTKKLFQPFVSVDTPVTASFVTKSNNQFMADSLLSPVKTGSGKTPLLDVLSTPQKISYHSSSENLFTSPPPALSNTSGGDIRNFGMFQDSEVASLPVDRKSDLPAKISSHDDKLPLKSQYFPEILDPLNVSPKAGQSVRKKDADPLIKMPVHQGSLDRSRSSSPIPRQTLPNEFANFRGESARTMVSPKVSPALPSSGLDTDSASLSSKSHPFGSAAKDILPTASVPSSTPQGFGSSAASNAGGLSVLASPAIDITVNPLGTGYFNALTQKFIDPTFSLGADFSKPSVSSTSVGEDGQKQKIYFENGVIMNQDYDKISDTNDEDNLERLIEDIDTKTDNIDKGYSEIEDLLNEFNEKQLEDMKNKSHIDDFMKNDDFLKNVIEDASKSKSDNSNKADDNTFNPPPEEFEEMNKSIISDILEQEKERIDKESTEMENARLSGLMNSSTTTSSSVTVSSPTLTSTVTSVSSTDPKVSTSAGSGEKKEDDPVDFEIPKVGKLMKIRKYFQIQEQKRKEQTEKVSEIRVHEKTEAPPSEDKPQTILVQVSKRKKIEYGPYLNRQSLLEGKPKANIDSNSPPKTHRPKPKPPLPEKRTFNLRERKTKTDFATLATTGSRTAETKKTDTKQKTSENDEKNFSEKEDKEEVKERKVENKAEGTETNEVKIVTRNQEKKKEVDPEAEKIKAKPNKGTSKSSNETEKEKDTEHETKQETKQKDIKAVLRTRSARNETENTDGKNLRKRTIKSTTVGDQSGSKIKIKKTDESVQKTSTESEEKVTRSKSKLKATPEKTGIKKCSVNLGEKYMESKGKSQIEKSDNKTNNIINIISNESKEQRENKMEVDEVSVKSNETFEAKTNETEKKKCILDTDLNILEKTEEDSNKSHEADTISTEQKIVDNSVTENNSSKDEGEKQKVELKIRSNSFQKTNRKGNKTRSVRRESNIFDKIDQTEYTEKEHSAHKTDESQMVSITSTDNTDKKVTMKLKLGPNFQKAFELFNPRKRKHETHNVSGHSLEKETKKEQKIEKKFTDAPENDSEANKKLENNVKSDSVKECKIENEENTVKESVETEIETFVKTDEVFPDKNIKEIVAEENTGEKDLENDLKKGTFSEDVEQQKSEKEMKQNSDKEINKDTKEGKVEKKVKHSVENEFQRLVNEAMAEAQKEGETAKSKNLRKRLNENVKYNVDESDDELDKLKLLDFITSSKSQKSTPKGSKVQMKGTATKGKSKFDITGVKENESVKQLQPKKDVDVYDFTDTEMSDSEESTAKKLGFKPKYVSNLNLFGQKKLPFVSKPMSPLENSKAESQTEYVSESAAKHDSENDDADSGISYVGKTVEPLKIKLTKIIPFKEKKHKHKKKKRKREKERREGDIEKFDSESRESAESGGNKKLEEDFQKSEGGCELENSETKKIEEVKSVDSIGQESNSNSNEGDDDQLETGTSAKSNRRAKLKEKKHICEYCNVGFGQKCDLRRHIMIHTGERPYPCQICDKRFQRKTDLVKHTRTHTGEKPYACEFCDKRVSDKSQLNVHRRLHTGDRPYCCSKCGKKCITSSELSRHRAVHCGEKVERCSLCKKAFTVKECLGMHMKLHYRSRGKSFKCEKCVIGFDKKADLDSHHCVDPMKNVYVCSECYEEFCDEMLYAEHIKTHDLGVLACNVCTNIFEDKHSLETHLCSLGMEKQKQLTCDICDMEFQDQDLLNQHLTAHDNDEGSFMCDLCSEIFSVRKAFIEHSKHHELVSGKLTAGSPGSSISKETSHMIGNSQIFSHFAQNNSEISDKSVDGESSIVKQEVDCDDFNFLGSSNENTSNIKANALGLKSEMDEVNRALPSNRSRASVISGTFRIDDESGDSRQSNVQEKLTFPKSNFNAESFVTGTGKGPVKRTPSSVRSPDFLAGDRFFEPTDFSNSPDFSTLTEGDDLDLSPFASMSDPLKKESDKSVKMSQSTSAKQIDRSASLDLKQKIMKQFSTNSQPSGSIPVSESGVSTSHGLMRQSSARSLPMKNSQISALLSSETTTTHSSNSSQVSRGQLQRSASTGHTSPFSNSQNNLSHGSAYQPNSQNKRWSGFQMSAADFVNSFLGETKADSLVYESKSYGTKPDPFTQSLSKSLESTVNVENRNDAFNKDNIENQIKSELFSEFDISPSNQKSDSSITSGSFKQTVPHNNYGNTSSGVFHGINPNSFSQRQFHQNFPEKSDFTSFGHQFVGPFTQTSSYSSNVSNSTLKSNATPDVYSLDSNVTPDVNKRHLQGMYGGRTDTIQNSSFYLSSVDDSIKDLAGSDKDETTALLSNFDQF